MSFLFTVFGVYFRMLRLARIVLMSSFPIGISLGDFRLGCGYKKLVVVLARLGWVLMIGHPLQRCQQA
jgi:hypothetical protein